MSAIVSGVTMSWTSLPSHNLACTVPSAADLTFLMLMLHDLWLVAAAAAVSFLFIYIVHNCVIKGKKGKEAYSC